VQRAVKQAVRDAELTKPATPHTLRHYAEFLTMPSRLPLACAALEFAQSYSA